MKIKLHQYFGFFFILLINIFSTSLSNNKKDNAATFVITSDQSCENLLLHTPIKFTDSGINCFLKHTYNHPKYASDIIPHNTAHFLQLLADGSDSNQTYEYMTAVLRLFRQKVSAAEYLSATEVARLTQNLNSLLTKFFELKEKSLKKGKKRGHKYFAKLKQKLKDHKKASKKIKNLSTRLVENCLGKILWCDDDHTQIWPQFLNIGNNVASLLEKEIINDEDDLNDMIHILINRLSYNLKIMQTDLPPSFFTSLKKSLKNREWWLDIEEIEDLINNKVSNIENAINTSSIRSQAAHKFGIL